LPIAVIGSLWITLTFFFAASTSIYLVGLLLLPVFALSWRAIAKLELLAINLIGDRWRVVPSAAPIIPTTESGSFLATVVAILCDPYTHRATIYFMFVKFPLAYLSIWLTVGLPMIAFRLLRGAFFILFNAHEILNGQIIFLEGGEVDGIPSTRSDSGSGSHGSGSHGSGSHGSGSHGSGSHGSGSHGSWSGSASSSFGSTIGSLTGSAMGFIPFDDHMRHNLDVGMFIEWLAAHPMVVAMVIPTAIFLLILSNKAVRHIANWHRIIAIAALGHTTAISPIVIEEESVLMMEKA